MVNILDWTKYIWSYTSDQRICINVLYWDRSRQLWDGWGVVLPPPCFRTKHYSFSKNSTFIHFQLCYKTPWCSLLYHVSQKTWYSLQSKCSANCIMYCGIRGMFFVKLVCPHSVLKFSILFLKLFRFLFAFQQKLIPSTQWPCFC